MAETSAQISASIDALMQEFYTITHNLANVSTAGYKRRCNAFSKSLEDYPLGTQEFIPGEINIESALDLSQGSIVETGRPMDFALYGKGFFVIETPQGPLYTRNGTFFTNQNGQIVDSEARVVEGQAGAITIPNDIALSDVHVASDGSISARGVAIGKFNLVDFQDDETKLVPVGSSCFQMSDEKVRPRAADNVVVKQGYQEGSNVRIVEELVDMIMVSRLYEANMKLVTANKDTSGSILSVAMG
jgi:flagellar basal body rod protein FlgG